jgi:hypothetical protein
MDRRIVYPGSIPQDTDILTPQQDAMIALGWVIQAVMGTATGVVGLACTPSTPASMTVNVGEGAIWMPSTIEATSFGSLGADASPLMKMGINKEAAGTNFTLTAPGGAGTSINYLIEGTLLEQDTSAVVLPYVNAANPAQPYSGPNNTGVAQNTTRAQTVELQLKAGAAATTGTQTTPATDTGYVPLYVITVNYGQSQIVAGNISIAPSAPFIGGVSPLSGRLLGYQFMTSSGANTVPAGCTKMDVFLQGAGGAGGGCQATGSSSYCAASGGGAGAHTVRRSIVAQSASVTIGAAGSPVLGLNGGAGGATSFLTYSAAGGGGGLQYGPSNNFVAAGPAGGASAGGAEDTGGANGLNGFVINGLLFGGSGGSSQYGGGGAGSDGSNGLSATGFGSGGGGASNNNSSGQLTGGSGGSGCALFVYYS